MMRRDRALESAASAVKDYFDRNTRGFLRFGQSGRVGAIRRAVWGPGVSDRAGAFAYVDERLSEQLRAAAGDRSEPFVVDLGCGVGASLAHLARTHPLHGLGVTISPVQVELARRRFAELGLADRLACEECDFAELPPETREVDLAYGIESFVLAPDARAFFAEAARVLRPGGRLVVCDDFLAPDRPAADRRARRWLEEFRRGWRVRSLMTVAEADAAATEAGLTRVSDEDWTDWLELRRPRDQAITALVTLGRHLPLHHPWWMNLVGGNALQMALVHRLIRYHFVVWQRA